MRSSWLEYHCSFVTYKALGNLSGRTFFVLSTIFLRIVYRVLLKATAIPFDSAWYHFYLILDVSLFSTVLLNG